MFFPSKLQFYCSKTGSSALLALELSKRTSKKWCLNGFFLPFNAPFGPWPPIPFQERSPRVWPWGQSYNLWITPRWKGLFIIIIISSDTHFGFGLIPGSTSIFSPETAQVAERRCINPPCADLEISLLPFCWFLSTQAIRTKSHL